MRKDIKLLLLLSNCEFTQVIFSALEKYCLKKLSRIKTVMAGRLVHMTDH